MSNKIRCLPFNHDWGHGMIFDFTIDKTFYIEKTCNKCYKKKLLIFVSLKKCKTLDEARKKVEKWEEYFYAKYFEKEKN